MNVPIASRSIEIEVKRSRFIALAEPVSALAQVKEIITTTRATHPQANHVVHAAILGEEGTQFSLSDDHEPKNTAGRPVLEVLKGSGITNILVMVVRYFGGTLLGTGGLVKAYGDATKAVLDGLKTEELIERKTLKLIISYDIFDQVKNIIAAAAGTCSETFATDVTIHAIIPVFALEQVVTQVTNLSSGRACIEIGQDS